MAYSWLSTFALVFVPGLVIYLVLFLISKIMNSPKIYAEFKQNMNELVMTLFIFIFIVVLFGISDDLALYRLTPVGQVPTLINGSLDNINQMADNVSLIITSTDKFNKDASMQGSSSSFCTLAGMFGASLSGCGSYSVLTSGLPMVLNALVVSLSELKTILTLLQFSGEYAITLLLPLGLILRIFSFTRGAGSVILAIAITLYFVVPFTILIYFDLMQYIPLQHTKDVTPVDFKLPKIPTCDAADVTSANLLSVQNIIPSVVSLISTDMYFFVVITLLTSLVLAVLVATPMALSKALGVYVDFSSLQRLI